MSATDPAVVMNFLNEVSSRHPKAVSFAAGRPTDVLFEHLTVTALTEALSHFVSREMPSFSLLQYGRTAGIINSLIAEQLRVDEGVPSSAERLLVTAGCQEAISLCLASLCSDPGDAVLVCNPTYVGATGAAMANGVIVRGLPSLSHDLPNAIDSAARALQIEGHRARVLYLIPTFDNPTGYVLDLNERLAVIEACARNHIVVLEDNPYGMFRYDRHSLPTLASLDSVGCVIYMSTYSKTISPALRIGSVSLPETLFGDRKSQISLFNDLVSRKSYGTVNTSQISQAMVGGHLLLNGCSLQEWVAPARECYRNKRDILLAELDRVFRGSTDISWTHPEGGFFLTVDLPIEFNSRTVAECVERENVIVMPMAFFSLDASQDRRVRLAFSSVEANSIAEGVRSFARFVSSHGHT